MMYFVVSVTNNYALNFNISMPLHMIFRAVSLSATRERYSAMPQIDAAFVVQTAEIINGVCVCF